MRALRWVVPLFVVLLLLGLVFGVAAIFLAPVLGVLLVIGLVMWMLERRSTGRPATEPPIGPGPGERARGSDARTHSHSSN